MANNNINRALNGINSPLSYMGINAGGAYSASQTVVHYRAPTINDSKNFIIGCLWLWPDTDHPVHAAQIWILTALLGNDATWTQLEAGAATGIITIDGDVGSITGPLVSIKGNATAGKTVAFVALTATDMVLNVTDQDGNTAIGFEAGNSLTAGGDHNTILGDGAAISLTTGSFNTIVGSDTAANLIDGFSNAIIGASAGQNITTGINNTIIGISAGNNLTFGDSDNILINNSGVAADSGVIRIGSNGNQTTAYMAGIAGVTVSNENIVTIDTVTGQLGSTPGGSGNIDKIEGDNGTFITGNTVSIKANATAGKTVNFIGDNATAMTLDVTDADNNTTIGLNSGISLVGGANNTSLGSGAAISVSTGDLNIIVGSATGVSLDIGSNNTIVGSAAAGNLVSGSDNVIIGRAAGGAYTTSESSNILIDNDGVITDAGAIRIGTNAVHTQTFIAGVDGVSLTTANVVTEVGDQFGTAIITAGTGITVTPGANTITIAATDTGTGSSAWAVAQTTIVVNTTTLYLAPFGASSAGSTHSFISPVSGTLSKLYVRVLTNASTTNTTITLNVNGAPTSLVATITALTTGVFTDLVNSATIVAGDEIQLECQQGTTGDVVGSVSMKLVA